MPSPTGHCRVTVRAEWRCCRSKRGIIDIRNVLVERSLEGNLALLIGLGRLDRTHRRDRRCSRDRWPTNGQRLSEIHGGQQGSGRDHLPERPDSAGPPEHAHVRAPTPGRRIRRLRGVPGHGWHDGGRARRSRIWTGRQRPAAHRGTAAPRVRRGGRGLDDRPGPRSARRQRLPDQPRIRCVVRPG